MLVSDRMKGSVRLYWSMGTLRATPGVVLTERCPCLFSSRSYTLLGATNTVQGGANVEGEDGRAIEDSAGCI